MSRKNSPKLVVVQLNELNFDVVRAYVKMGELPAFGELLETYRAMETYAEDEYANLEPWIQWVSAHTGKSFSEHRVFRLGDMVQSDLPQVFEQLESKGLRVGALSPMNSCNRLKRPAYFIPDPWTQTESDGAPFSRRLTEMLRQTVNDNSQGRISFRSLLTLLECIARTLDPRQTVRLLRHAFASRNRSWSRALVLDQLVHMVHLHLMRIRSPDVSFAFLNAGAHIQHHYFLNSKAVQSSGRNPEWYCPKDADPLLDLLRAYDSIVGDYLAMSRRGVRVLIATGLTQIPYDRVKYYYRLKDHAEFARGLGLVFKQALPRMTRDFEMTFEQEVDQKRALAVLGGAKMRRDGKSVFGEIEERSNSLFVTLTYPEEILRDDIVDTPAGGIEQFGDKVAFVAVKNGMHSTRGFAFFSKDVPAQLPREPVHVSSLFRLTMESAG